MTKYPNVDVIITDKDASPLKLILKTASAMAHHQLPTWVRLEFMEIALNTSNVIELKKLCKDYVNLQFNLKNIVF